jgi:hypothetical protein
MINVLEGSQDDGTNKTENANKTKEQTIMNQVRVQEFADSQDEEDIDEFAKMKEEKIHKQIMAAKRSLKTNFIVAILFTGLTSVLVILPKNAKMYYAATVLSSMKTVLPIFTAIANFGPVKSVVCQYWKHVTEKIKCR